MLTARSSQINGPAGVYAQISRWCAYQERSQHETRKKLQQMGVPAGEEEPLIARLISDNFLNEERFACAYAGGKFRMKMWGPVKIRSGLYIHKISEANVATALRSISEADCFNAMRVLIRKRSAGAEPADRKRRYHSLLNHLVSRGFERDQAREALNSLIGEVEDELRS